MYGESLRRYNLGFAHFLTRGFRLPTSPCRLVEWFMLVLGLLVSVKRSFHGVFEFSSAAGDLFSSSSMWGGRLGMANRSLPMRNLEWAEARLNSVTRKMENILQVITMIGWELVMMDTFHLFNPSCFQVLNPGYAVTVAFWMSGIFDQPGAMMSFEPFWKDEGLPSRSRCSLEGWCSADVGVVGLLYLPLFHSSTLSLIEPDQIRTSATRIGIRSHPSYYFFFLRSFTG